MRTMRLSSSDAAVEGSLGHSLRRDMVNRKALAWANGASRRASGWAGENDARSWDHPSHPVKSDNSLGLCLEPGASQGKESVLADSGREGEITVRVGWVRSLVFLSILRG